MFESGCRIEVATLPCFGQSAEEEGEYNHKEDALFTKTGAGFARNAWLLSKSRRIASACPSVPLRYTHRVEVNRPVMSGEAGQSVLASGVTPNNGHVWLPQLSQFFILLNIT